MTLGLALILFSGAPSLSYVLPVERPVAEAEKVYNAQTFTLNNGMQVVVISNHRAPVVTHMVWYKVGAADEPQGDGVSGAAHFLEHLMFKGSRALDAGQFSKIIRSLGGEDNAFTSWDYTAYFQSISKQHLPTVMALEAERMINLTLPPSEIGPEYKVIMEERRERTDNEPRQIAFEQMRSLLFTGSPYATPIIGWRDEMPKLTREHVLDYYKTWYTPLNAILVVSGDVTVEEVKTLAEKYYSVIPSHDVPAHMRPPSPDFPAPITMQFRNADIREPIILRAWRAPSYIGNRAESLALSVLVETLDGGASTELYQNLVVKKKKASSISLSYDSDQRGEGSLWLSAVPAPQVSIEELEQEILMQFRQLIGNGIDEVAVEKAKTRIIDNAYFARDSVTGPAMAIGQALSFGATLEDVETWPSQIMTVTPAQVQKAMDTFLHPVTPYRQPVTAYLLPLTSDSKGP